MTWGTDTPGVLVPGARRPVPGGGRASQLLLYGHNAITTRGLHSNDPVRVRAEAVRGAASWGTENQAVLPEKELAKVV